VSRVLAVIPARGGSKGLPGKNLRQLAGLPLIVHSIRYAQMCPDIDRLIVSTDSEDIARTAREAGAEVPFLRPSELARDDTPMWPVLQHALQHSDNIEDVGYDYLLLLDPTSPAREPRDVTAPIEKLNAAPDADGIVSVSQPDFNPIWHCVVEKNGWMTPLITEGAVYDRRQDVPTVYRINGAIYLWRSEFVRSEAESWRNGRLLIHEIPEYRSMSIDTEAEFERAEQIVQSGVIRFPWMETQGSPCDP
jgi:CMP-N,N'-diacetyllegionaminic acid synthase